MRRAVNLTYGKTTFATLIKWTKTGCFAAESAGTANMVILAFSQSILRKSVYADIRSEKRRVR